jgi:hypothetical protein
MNLTATQFQFRDELRRAIVGLRANGILEAIYTSPGGRRAPDVENILFYNVGTSVFREVGKRVLRFTRKSAPVRDVPAGLSFGPCYHVRYQVGGTETSLPDAGAGAAVRAQIVCRRLKELKELPALWKAFRAAMISIAETSGESSDPFTLRMVISAPKSCRINLAEVMKPLADAFISALHRYQGEQLDEIVSRLSIQLSSSPEDVRQLLLRVRATVLGPRAVPHLRARGLQWSPADDLLAAGEFVRETSEGGLIGVTGELSFASDHLHPAASR